MPNPNISETHGGTTDHWVPVARYGTGTLPSVYDTHLSISHDIRNLLVDLRNLLIDILRVLEDGTP